MSAWLLGSDLLSDIRDFIAHEDIKQSQPMPLAVEKATKLVKAFNKMNRYAIGCRYGDKTKPAKLRAFNFDAKPITVHQFFKNMECLCYQCSEGDTEKKHRATWNKMEKMIHQYARNIAFTHPAVEAAEWG